METIEEYSLESNVKPLDNNPKCGNFEVWYNRYDNYDNHKDYIDGHLPLDSFRVIDPMEYPDRDLPTYLDGFSGDLQVNEGVDGNKYIEVSIIDGNESFTFVDERSIWKGGLKHINKESDLTEKQLYRVNKIREAVLSVLPLLLEKNPDNQTFKFLNKHLELLQDPTM